MSSAGDVADVREGGGGAGPAVRLHEVLYWVVVGLALYIPMEDFLLKWLPVSDVAYSVARQASEAVIYGLLLAVVAGRLSEGRFLRKTPADVPLAVFLGLALTSLVVNDGDLLTGAVTVRTLLRYVALFYAVVNLPVSDRQVRVLVSLIVATGLAQCGLGVWQFLQGGPGQVWLPRATALEVGGVERNFSILEGGVELGAVIGTFGHSVSMALYLMVCAAIVVSLIFNGGGPGRRLAPPPALFVVLAVVVGGLLLTYSRSTFLCVLAGCALVAYWRRRRRGLLKPLLVVSGAALVLAVILSVSDEVGAVRVKETRVNPLQNIRMATNPEVLQGGFANTRVWMIREVGGTVLSSVSAVGYSPDPETARRGLVRESEGALKRLLTFEPIEDVFWVAMLSYYGLLGVGAFAWLLARLYRASRELMDWERDFWTRTVATSTAVLIVMLVPLTFMVRTFEFRSLAFYLWLLAGLTVHRYVRGGTADDPGEEAPATGLASRAGDPPSPP